MTQVWTRLSARSTSQFFKLSPKGARTEPALQPPRARHFSGVQATSVTNATIQGLPPLKEGNVHVSRTEYQVNANDDFVKDYRELAKMPIWDKVFSKVPHTFHALDVCCGTGRWANAFSDIVCRERGVVVPCDFLDWCQESLTVLEKRKSEMPNIKLVKADQHDLGRRGSHTFNASSYDLVVNMHGLYGLPPKVLRPALTFMHNMLREGGQLVIALGSEDSLYQKIPAKLEADGILDERFTSVPQVLEACRELGIEIECNSLLYYEEYDANDKEKVDRFVFDECVGNTFTADGTPKFTKEQLWESLKPLVHQYLDASTNRYKFKQDISILTLKKNAYVPDMLSNDSFYDDAYVLRRHASTMQSSMMEFLKSSGQDAVWSGVQPRANKRLNMLTIGCGDGEVDFALLDSFVKSEAVTGVDVVALEPNERHTNKFSDELPKQSWYGSDVTVSVENKVWHPSSMYPAADGEMPDVALFAHVLYYFDDKAAAIKGAVQQVRPGGTAVIIHQGAEGVPEIQEKLLPRLRGNTADMFTSATIEEVLQELQDGSDEVASFCNYKIDAYMNTKETVKGTPDGVQIMSFCLESDLRAANHEQISSVTKEFALKSSPGPVPGHDGEGPFMYEPVHCFVIKRR